MNLQFLKINPDKTEIILFYPKSVEHKVIVGGTIIGSDCIRFSKEVKNVGVWLDNQLNFNKHVNNKQNRFSMLYAREEDQSNTEHTITTTHRNIDPLRDYQYHGLL